MARVIPPFPASFHYSRIAPFSGVMLPRWPQVGAAGWKQPTLLLGVLDEARNKAMLSPEILAAALLKLLSDPEECHRIGENSRAVSEQFLWPRVIKRFEASYYQAVDDFKR